MSASSLQDFDRLDPLLSEALDLPQRERADFAREVCAGDDRLEAALLELLAAADADSPAIRPGGALGAEFRAALAAGDSQAGTIDRYRLVREIGQGGMAQVYLARRADGLFEQDVALKIMWPGMIRPDLLARFEQERRILAQLNDPHIARLLDGGVTGDGRPWLAMDYISGERIDRYCDTLGLNVERRIDLLLDVISAVASAHRQGIVHRDIKPSNVMVTEAGDVKLVDFGIAKLIGDDQTGAPEALTRTGMRVLTPEYASPEQIEGQAVGRGSDIYQLGLLAYELLTGSRPFGGHDISPLTLQRLIVETPPPLPSRIVRRAAGRSAAILARTLVGELDAVIMKALEKDPARRYASAEALERDFRNYRLGLPVAARSGRGYRLRKFVARHRLAVAAGVSIAALLVAYAGTVTLQARRIAAERDVARLETAKAQEIAAFMQELFEYASPEVSQGQQMSIRDMVDRGAEQLEGRLADQPRLKAAMLDNLGAIYVSLGEYEAAVARYQESLTLREELDGPGHISTADTLQGLARARRGAGQFDRAIGDLENVLAIRRRELGEDHLSLATIFHELGETHSELRQNDIAAGYHERALELRRRYLPPDHLDVILSLSDYGVVLARQQRNDEAARIYRQALEVLERRLGPAHPRTLTTLRNLAALEGRIDHLHEAERLLREVLRREQMIYDGDHPKMAWTLGFLARTAVELGELERAEAHWREAVRVLSATLPERHLHTAGATHELAKILLQNGKTEEACERLQWSLAIRLEQRGEAHLQTNESRLHLAQCLARLGRRDAARELLARAEPHLKDTPSAPLLAAALAELD